MPHQHSSRQAVRVSSRPPRGFTLVEVLVVIAIITIVMGITIPAVTSMIAKGKTATIRAEISGIEKAVQQYLEKYGDYPPDFSSWSVVERHYNKLFPRMSTNDKTLLFNLLHTGSPAVFQAAELDRAEALVWTLGGYSDDIQRPFTGPGGPLEWTGNGSNNYTDGSVTDTDRQSPANFQANIDRAFAFFDFKPAQLNYSDVDAASAVTGSNRRLSTDDGDHFPTYAAQAGGAPYVYFDSRTYTLYDTPIGDYNGFNGGGFGVVRPFYSTNSNANRTTANYASDTAALAAWQFIKPDSFQIISAGLDDIFGATASFDVDGDTVDEPVYFQYATGTAVAPRTDVSTPAALQIADVRGYQETSVFGGIEEFQLDNVTNFSNAKIVDDVP